MSHRSQETRKYSDLRNYNWRIFTDFPKKIVQPDYSVIRLVGD